MESNVLKRLLKNPHYKLSNKELEVHTQEVRNEDINVIPKVRRKKRAKRKSVRHTMSQENVGQEVQEEADLS